MNFKNLWHRLAMFFEHGDLTPVAVLISVAHYGPVLVAHGESVIVAWGVGALIDLLHFRTVRKLFQVKGSWSIAGHAGIALATTLMAAMYHLRFYAGDWLLAIPIPVGIAILAQHAASNGQDATVTKWRNRARSIIESGKKWRQVAKEYEVKNAVLTSQVAKLQADLRKQEADKLPAVKPERVTVEPKREKVRTMVKSPTDWRQLSDKQKAEIAKMSPEDLAKSRPELADRTRRLWLQRASELSANGHSNGVHK